MQLLLSQFTRSERKTKDVWNSENKNEHFGVGD
jgi:hypothetical protein